MCPKVLLVCSFVQELFSIGNCQQLAANILLVEKLQSRIYDIICVKKKNVKNTHEEVLLLVELQAKSLKLF